MKNNNKNNGRTALKMPVKTAKDKGFSNNNLENISRKDIGKAGETAACVYLRSKGHNVLARNMKIGRGEIDILTIKDKTIHIVEVKTSRADSPLAPEESLTPIKLKRLTSLAKGVLSQYPNNPIFNTLDCDQKIDRGAVLMDEPAIQIDGIVVRLTFSGRSISKVTVKYYPYIC